MFENKIDHTTYFDPHIEAIQGIHMIPILPPTPFIRCKGFVKEEWEAFFSNGRIDDIRNAWRGIIVANYATVDPKMAWDFFTSPNFEPQLLDGGASLTWFMTYAAGELSSEDLNRWMLTGLQHWGESDGLAVKVVSGPLEKNGTLDAMPMFLHQRTELLEATVCIVLDENQYLAFHSSSETYWM